MFCTPAGMEWHCRAACSPPVTTATVPSSHHLSLMVLAIALPRRKGRLKRPATGAVTLLRVLTGLDATRCA